jgi:hypothetical protein
MSDVGHFSKDGQSAKGHSLKLDSGVDFRSGSGVEYSEWNLIRN